MQTNRMLSTSGLCPVKVLKGKCPEEVNKNLRLRYQCDGKETRLISWPMSDKGNRGMPSDVVIPSLRTI